jgi:hypothetical protein
MPDSPIAYSTFATAAGEYTPATTTVPTTALVAGTNIVAVEMHQGNATSSDLSFDLQIVGNQAPRLR